MLVKAEVIKNISYNYGHTLFAEVINVNNINHYIQNSDFYSNKLAMSSFSCTY